MRALRRLRLGARRLHRLRPALRAGLRVLLAGQLAPRRAAWASAVGAAVGVAPLPGLQFLTAAGLAWALRLNVPLVLLWSNLSFGPLLLMWGALSAALGVWLRSGASPLATYRELLARHAGEGWRAAGALAGEVLGDWLVGSLVVVPCVAVAAGACGWVVAAQLIRRRARIAAAVAASAARAAAAGQAAAVLADAAETATASPSAGAAAPFPDEAVAIPAIRDEA